MFVECIQALVAFPSLSTLKQAVRRGKMTYLEKAVSRGCDSTLNTTDRSTYVCIPWSRLMVLEQHIWPG